MFMVALKLLASSLEVLTLRPILNMAVYLKTHLPSFCGFITPHAQRVRGKVIDRGVHIYIYIYLYIYIYIYILYIYVCGRKKYLSRTLEIDSPFQTLTVGLLIEFID